MSSPGRCTSATPAATAPLATCSLASKCTTAQYRSARAARAAATCPTSSTPNRGRSTPQKERADVIEVAIKFLLPGGGSTRESYYFPDIGGGPAGFAQNALAIVDARHKCNSKLVRIHSVSVSDTALPQKSINLRAQDVREGQC